MDATLCESVARRIAAWMDTGAFHARNEEHWRNRTAYAENRIVELEAKVRGLEAERDELLDLRKFLDDVKQGTIADERIRFVHNLITDLTVSRQQVERLAQALERCLDTYSRTSKRIPPTTQEAEKMLDDIREANQGAREALSAIEQHTKGRKS